ncbi:hypothetical protein AALO_G00203480 [Alosa alosa]|uniref:Murine leukemia virus integrase C-terminal domain-containing protein n=1 Tax=Alosa alosa TaxID=278164 RepID=A0AAV6G627_9TELE|nr:hypothetical protein AALO_G00203480 [Alosa alosa]
MPCTSPPPYNGPQPQAAVGNASVAAPSPAVTPQRLYPSLRRGRSLDREAPKTRSRRTKDNPMWDWSPRMDGGVGKVLSEEKHQPLHIHICMDDGADDFDYDDKTPSWPPQPPKINAFPMVELPNPTFRPGEQESADNRRIMHVYRTWTQEDVKKAIEGVASHKAQIDEFCDEMKNIILVYHLNGFEVERMFRCKMGSDWSRVKDSFVAHTGDVFSKWVELFPCRTPDAAAVAKALCRRIIPSHGVPRLIRSDNGTHFVNEDPKVKPGDWVFIKVIKRKSWAEPRWQGPHQVVLATPTAVKVRGRISWTHISHCKVRDIPAAESTAVERKSDYKGV